jgi:hypothetical protein
MGRVLAEIDLALRPVLVCSVLVAIYILRATVEESLLTAVVGDPQSQVHVVSSVGSGGVLLPAVVCEVVWVVGLDAEGGLVVDLASLGGLVGEVHFVETNLVVLVTHLPQLLLQLGLPHGSPLLLTLQLNDRLVSGLLKQLHGLTGSLGLLLQPPNLLLQTPHFLLVFGLALLDGLLGGLLLGVEFLLGLLHLLLQTLYVELHLLLALDMGSTLGLQLPECLFVFSVGSWQGIAALLDGLRDSLWIHQVEVVVLMLLVVVLVIGLGTAGRDHFLQFVLQFQDGGGVAGYILPLVSSRVLHLSLLLDLALLVSYPSVDLVTPLALGLFGTDFWFFGEHNV